MKALSALVALTLFFGGGCVSRSSGADESEKPKVDDLPKAEEKPKVEEPPKPPELPPADRRLVSNPGYRVLDTQETEDLATSMLDFISRHPRTQSENTNLENVYQSTKNLVEQLKDRTIDLEGFTYEQSGLIQAYKSQDASKGVKTSVIMAVYDGDPKNVFGLLLLKQIFNSKGVSRNNLDILVQAPWNMIDEKHRLAADASLPGPKIKVGEILLNFAKKSVTDNIGGWTTANTQETGKLHLDSLNVTSTEFYKKHGFVAKEPKQVDQQKKAESENNPSIPAVEMYWSGQTSP